MINRRNREAKATAISKALLKHSPTKAEENDE
jgi:hypothetical protein